MNPAFVASHTILTFKVWSVSGGKRRRLQPKSFLFSIFLYNKTSQGLFHAGGTHYSVRCSCCLLVLSIYGIITTTLVMLQGVRIKSSRVQKLHLAVTLLSSRRRVFHLKTKVLVPENSINRFNDALGESFSAVNCV